MPAGAQREPVRLDVVQIRTPCTEDWGAMQGDDQVRFCGVCHQNVFNLSAMTREAAEALIEEHEGRLCVRLYKRPDGTVVTQDCGPSRTTHLHLLARRATRWAASLAGVTAAGLLGLGLAAQREDRPAHMPRSRLPPVVLELLDPFEPEPSFLQMDQLDGFDGSIVMGAMMSPVRSEEEEEARQRAVEEAEARVREAIDAIDSDPGVQAILRTGGRRDIDLAPEEAPGWAQEAPGGAEAAEAPKGQER